MTFEFAEATASVNAGKRNLSHQNCHYAYSGHCNLKKRLTQEISKRWGNAGGW
jgi:hypothetical protein